MMTLASLKNLIQLQRAGGFVTFDEIGTLRIAADFAVKLVESIDTPDAHLLYYRSFYKEFPPDDGSVPPYLLTARSI